MDRAAGGGCAASAGFMSATDRPRLFQGYAQALVLLRETGAYVDDDRTLAFGGEADMHRVVGSSVSVVDDPKQTSSLLTMSRAQPATTLPTPARFRPLGPSMFIHPCSREYWRTFGGSPCSPNIFSKKVILTYMVRSSPSVYRPISKLIRGPTSVR